MNHSHILYVKTKYWFLVFFFISYSIEKSFKKRAISLVIQYQIYFGINSGENVVCLNHFLTSTKLKTVKKPCYPFLIWLFVSIWRNNELTLLIWLRFFMKVFCKSEGLQKSAKTIHSSTKRSEKFSTKKYGHKDNFVFH